MPADGMVVCHLPYGPTAYFGIFNAVLRHDIGAKKEVRRLATSFCRGGRGGGGFAVLVGNPPLGNPPALTPPPPPAANFRHQVGTISEAYPHLIFDAFTSQLGRRVAAILKHLFPVPKEDSKRVVTFANREDFVSFRHHTYAAPRGPKSAELTEVRRGVAACADEGGARWR